MDGLRISTAEGLIGSGKIPSTRVLPLPSSVNENSLSFADQLSKAVESVNALQKEAAEKQQQFATGENKNIAEVMIAAEKADIAFKLMVTVRNKILDAYQEIMRMQV